MKVIDLLNKIANGEELHFYVMNNGFKTEYFYEKGKPLRYDDDEDVEWRISEDWLNCEVEIIEEDKKIKKICIFPTLDDENFAYEDGNKPSNVLIHHEIEKLLINKINEIIEYLEENKWRK